MAFGLLDIEGPWFRREGHWGLFHFLLDGHHKAAVAAALGLCLLRREGYELVLARMAAALPWMFLAGPPTRQALSQARVRLGEAPMRQLFTDTAAAALPDTPGASAFGLALTAFDATVIHLPASKENLAAFTTRAFRSGLSGAALASAIRLSSC